MLRCVALLALGLTAWQAAAGGEKSSSPQHYLVHLHLADVSEGSKRPAKIIAAPSLTTAENREAVYAVGGSKQFAGEEIACGTRVRFRIGNLDGATVSLQGKLEVSDVHLADDAVVRESKAIYFDRQVELGEETEFTVSHPAGYEQTLVLRIERTTIVPPGAAEGKVPVY